MSLFIVVIAVVLFIFHLFSMALAFDNIKKECEDYKFKANHYKVGIENLNAQIAELKEMYEKEVQKKAEIKEEYEKEVQKSNSYLMNIQDMIKEYEQQLVVKERALDLACERLSKEVYVEEENGKRSAEEWKTKALMNVQKD